MMEVLLALALASETPPQGFSAETLAAQTAPAQRVDGALLARMEALREAMILNPQEAIAALEPMEARAITDAFGADEAVTPIQASWFFRATNIHTTPDGRIVGFYNPIVDAWVVARTQYAVGAWRIAEARIIDGANLRAGAPYWANASVDALAEFARNQKLSLDGFDARFNGAVSLEAAGPNDLAVLSQRIDAWTGALGAWGKDNAQVAALERVRLAIARGNVARLAPSGAVWRGREIDGLPQRVRATFAATACAARGDGHSVFLVSPLAPDIILVLDIADDAPASLSVVNLANAAQGEIAP